MKILSLLAFGTLLVPGLTALADENDGDVAIAVEVASPAHSVFRFNSDDIGFDIQAMQEGESRSIVDENGRAVLITRSADGFTVDVDGKTIDLPLPDERGAYHSMALATDVHDVDVRIAGAGIHAAQPFEDHVMIVSSQPLDAATQESIRSILLSAGHGSEVRFIDRGHAITVVRSEVEVHEEQ